MCFWYINVFAVFRALMCFSGFQCFSLWFLEVSSVFDLLLCLFSVLVFVCCVFCVLMLSFFFWFRVWGCGYRIQRMRGVWDLAGPFPLQVTVPEAALRFGVQSLGKFRSRD